MQRAFDEEFTALKSQILTMGVKVEKAIEWAIQGLIENDPKYFTKVHDLEEEINQAHIQVDDACLKLLARQSPLASDLRLVFSTVKINADLERMGDQAVNIAYNGAHYISKPPVKPLVDLPKMTIEVRAMVREAIDAFVKQDVILAKKVLVHDDVIDNYKRKIFDDLSDHMAKEPTTIKQALNLILIARNLERLGDHATNIAEEAIFDVSGQDIRHPLRRT